MVNNLNILIELSSIDNKIDELIPIEKETKLKLENIIKEKEHYSNFLHKIENEIENTIKNINLFNNEIIEINKKLENKKLKSNSLKNEREINALNIEIEILNEKLITANSEIEKNETIKKSKEENKEKIIEKISFINKKIAETNIEVSKSLFKIGEQKKQLLKNRENCLINLDPKIFKFYEKIRTWAKNTAVIKVKKQACYGCFMKINDHTFSNLIKKDEIVTCNQCGRILYLE